MPYKAKNWHALSHDKYFLKHRFIDICRFDMPLIDGCKLLKIFQRVLMLNSNEPIKVVQFKNKPVNQYSVKQLWYQQSFLWKQVSLMKTRKTLFVWQREKSNKARKDDGLYICKVCKAYGQSLHLDHFSLSSEFVRHVL